MIVCDGSLPFAEENEKTEVLGKLTGKLELWIQLYLVRKIKHLGTTGRQYH